MNESRLNEKEINEAMKKMGKIRQDGDVKIVELTDKIKFRCVQCGKCCTNREDIILNPFDIYQIAKEKSINIADVLEKYCSLGFGHISKFPIITLKQDERKLCPFLELIPGSYKFACSINNAKPGACKLHPIGAVRDVKNQKTTFIKVPSCSNHSEDTEVEVSDLVKQYLDKMDEHTTGNELMLEMMKYINPIQFFDVLNGDKETLLKDNDENVVERYLAMPEKLKNNLVEHYTVSALEGLLNLDTSVDFMKQVDTIKQSIRNSAVKFASLMSLLGINVVSDKADEDFYKDVLKLGKENLDIVKNFAKKGE